MINMLRKGIKFSIQRVYCPQSYFESRHYGKRFNSIGKFKSLTFQLRAIYFHTFAVDMSVHIGSQLYLGIILHYIQNVCKNKCAVCTLYSEYITYFRLGPRASF